MRIAVVHSFYGEASSGENLAVLRQCQALTDSGQEVKLFARYTEHLRKRLLFPLESAINVAFGFGPSPERDLQSFAPDVVHIHNLFPNWSDRWVKQYAGNLFWTVHNYRSVCAAGTLRRNEEACRLCPMHGSANAVRHGCYRGSRLGSTPVAIATRKSRNPKPFQFAKHLIFPSQLALETLHALNPVVSDVQSHVIPNFVPEWDVPRVSDRQAEKPFLYVGRVSADKGILELLRQWPPGTPLLVVGTGNELKRAQALASGKKVRFWGVSSAEGVARHMRSSQALILPSSPTEPAPTVYAEALMAGLPVIVKRPSAFSEEVETAQVGLSFDTADSLSNALQKTAERHIDFSENAYQLAKRKYSPDAWLAQILPVYRSSVSSR